jgi:hypothetical protein
MNGYIAIYNGRQIELHAESLYLARGKAEAVFNTKKSQKHMISVMLAEKDGKQVVHTFA